jgi:hypothetical protein
MKHPISRSMMIVAAASVAVTIRPFAAADPVSSWNLVATQAALAASQNGVVVSRTLAMVQVAVHDALNTIDPRYERYAFDGALQPAASVDAAVACAAYETLVSAIAVGPLPFTGFGTAAQQAAGVAVAANALASTVGADRCSAGDSGAVLGRAAAAAVVRLRSTDGATRFVSYTPGTRPGDWQPTPNPVPFDPPALADLLPAVLPGWGLVTPFVLRNSDRFEPSGPPRLTNTQYARDYDEVKAIGAKNSGIRTAEQTSIARFWYEPSPVAWSRIARVVADAHALDLWERARLLALVNLAMADGFIAGFETKYTFNFWRPVTAIRAGDTDGNGDTIGDPAWESLLNTPAIPDYTSTHSVLGGAASEVLRRFFRRDDVPFTTTSGAPFAGITRSFASFSDGARENGDSRIYAGIHFRTAVEDGIAEGRKIGRYVFAHSLRPIVDRDF